MESFEDFWRKYPRKVAKKDAARAWSKLTPQEQFAAIHAIPVHVRYWAAAGRTNETTPHPATWLNGARWEDELEMPAAPEVEQWWKTRSGIEAKARQLGIVPKPGEDYHSLKARIHAAEKAA